VIVVANAVGLPTDDPFRRDSLPAGYRFLVQVSTQTIIEPALLWLCHCFPPIRGRWRKITVSNAAYNLCDWWRFLENLNLTWTDVTEPDLISYGNESMSLVSARTHEHLDIETIRHRMRTVIAFYLSSPPPSRSGTPCTSRGQSKP